MKADTQHLEFLISQYVDGSLDNGAKRTLEQQLTVDPAARKILKDYRDLQDVLDDYGNRIPLINWQDFDQQLAARLEKETVGSASRLFWQRWAKPVAAAACLVLAAGLGYSWHAYTASTGNSTIVTVENGASNLSSARVVRIEGALADAKVTTSPSMRGVQIETPAIAAGGGETRVAIGGPHDMAVEGSIAGATAGMGDLSDAAKRSLGLGGVNTSTSAVTAGAMTQPRDLPEIP